MFCPQKNEKTPFKIAHNMPTMLFFSTDLAAHTAQKQKIQTAIMESVFIGVFFKLKNDFFGHILSEFLCIFSWS